MLLCDISNVGKNHRKRDSKDSRHGNDSKIPPERDVTEGKVRDQTPDGVYTRLSRILPSVHPISLHHKAFSNTELQSRSL